MISIGGEIRGSILILEEKSGNFFLAVMILGAPVMKEIKYGNVAGSWLSLRHFLRINYLLSLNITVNITSLLG